MLGFGIGKMEIKINEFNFNPGQPITGELHMTLKKPVKAKELSISLIGEKTTTTVAIGSSPGTRRRTVRILDLKHELCGEGEYPANQPLIYPFTINVPSDIKGKKMPGVIGNIQDFIGMFTPLGNVKWYLEGRLAIPWAIDLTKKVQVNII